MVGIPVGNMCIGSTLWHLTLLRTGSHRQPCGHFGGGAVNVTSWTFSKTKTEIIFNITILTIDFVSKAFSRAVRPVQLSSVPVSKANTSETRRGF